MSASQHPGAPETGLGKGRRSTPARIHARSLEHPVLATVEERVDYIASLMVEQIWTDETSRELQLGLGACWGLTVDGTGCPTVRGYSAQASRALHARAREDGGRYATLALQSLATVATKGKNSYLPGDKGAAVSASKELLKYAGLAEPEEDKSKPTTVVVVGQIATSPAMRMIVGAATGTQGMPALPEVIDVESDSDGPKPHRNGVSGQK